MFKFFSSCPKLDGLLISNLYMLMAALTHIVGIWWKLTLKITNKILYRVYLQVLGFEVIWC